MKVGLWAIGGLGNVSTCTALGLSAIRRGYTPRTGLLSDLPEFRNLDLCPVEEIIVGGHEIRNSDLYKEAVDFSGKNNVPSRDLVDKLKKDLLHASRNIRKGFTLNGDRALEKFKNGKLRLNDLTLRKIVREIQSDIAEFKSENKLDQIVVVNLASTENGLKTKYTDLDEFEEALDRNRKGGLLPSMVYAYAAIRAGYPYINFTASLGSSIPPFDELAIKSNTCHMGKDAKTGETLLKTAIAPMFYYRNLQILSWEAHNILGNNDGYVLSFDENKEPKIRDKNGVLPGILGYTPSSNVRIDYVESLGDWKTAWDFVHFRGFLDAKMSLQLVWQGLDSILAAPLVIDLVRLGEYTHRMGFRGAMTHLAIFFKAPYGTTEHNLFRQFELLRDFLKHVPKTV
jgi:myo-inositol-1-phosphate synthase